MPPKIAQISLPALTLLFAFCQNDAWAEDTLDRNGPAISQSPAATEVQPILPPIVAFTPSNSGWTANFSFADPVTEIQWGLAQDGRFDSTGFTEVYDQRTRRPMANTSTEIDAQPATIYVRYADLKGNWVGPFPVRFDPVTEIRRSHQRTLETTTQAWLAFRHEVPNILYYTHVSGYRCGVREFRMGLDKPTPDQAVALAPCDSKEDVDTHIWINPSVAFASAQLVYQDGTVSKVKIFTRAQP